MIFISFAHDRSQRLAALLKNLIHASFPTLPLGKVWISTHREKGTLWRKDLDRALRETRLAILIVTPDNYRSRWLHYEAGMFRHSLGTHTRIVVLVVPDRKGQISFTVEPPLDEFDRIEADEPGLRELLTTIGRDFYQGMPKRSPNERKILLAALSDYQSGAAPLGDSQWLNLIRTHKSRIAGPAGTIFRRILATRVLHWTEESMAELAGQDPQPRDFPGYFTKVTRAVDSAIAEHAAGARILALCGYKPWKYAGKYFEKNFQFARQIGVPGAVTRMFLEAPNQRLTKGMQAHARAPFVRSLVLPRRNRKAVDERYPGMFDYLERGFGCVVILCGDAVAFAHSGKESTFRFAKYTERFSVLAIQSFLEELMGFCSEFGNESDQQGGV